MKPSSESLQQIILSLGRRRIGTKARQVARGEKASRSLRKTLASVSSCSGAERMEAATIGSAASRLSAEAGA
jgi:hypothetical protein